MEERYCVVAENSHAPERKFAYIGPTGHIWFDNKPRLMGKADTSKVALDIKWQRNWRARVVTEREVIAASLSGEGIWV